MDKIRELLEKNIVRIECEISKPNIFIPYATSNAGTSYGSGFFISETHILTNHHVIRNSKKIYIYIPSIGKQPFEAELKCYNIDNDYAIIKIINYKNKSKLFNIGNSDTLKYGNKLFVSGFPLGSYNTNLKLVQGTVTGWERNRIQHDSQTNPGMSGGIILDCKYNIVGIHYMAIVGKNQTNTAYAIPINIIRIKKRLDLIKNKKECSINIENVHLGFETQKAHNILIDNIIKNKKLIKPNIGVIITEIYDNFKTEMKEGDIVYKIDDYIIDNYKEIHNKLNTINKLEYHYLTHYRDVGDKYTIIFYSAKKNKLIKETHKFKSKDELKQNKLVKYDFLKEIPKYVIFGGFILVELTLAHLKSFLKQGVFKIFCEYIKNKDNLKNNNLLIVSHTFQGTSIYKNKIIEIGSIIEEVNDIRLKSLQHYEDIILKNTNKYIKYKLHNKLIDVIDFKESIKNELQLSKDNNYPLTFVKKLLSKKLSSNRSKKISSNKSKKLTQSKSSKQISQN